MRKKWKDLTPEERAARKKRAKPGFILLAVTCVVLAAALMIGLPKF